MSRIVKLKDNNSQVVYPVAHSDGIKIAGEEKTLTQKIEEIPDIADRGANSDLDISDDNGKVLARFEDGHFKTKNFDSSVNLMYPTEREKLGGIESGAQVNKVDTADGNGDLDISDEMGNILLRLTDGHVKTKNFDSAEVGTRLIEGQIYNDLAIEDESGNAILRITRGHIVTKNFDSSQQDYFHNNSFRGKKMVINGASTDWGTTLTSPYANSYGALAAKMLGMSYVNYAIGGTCFSKEAGTYDGVFFSFAEFEAATKDTSKRYLVKDGNVGIEKPWHIYAYSNGNWASTGNTTAYFKRTPLVDRLPEMDTDADVIIIGSAASNDWAYRGDNFGANYIYDVASVLADEETAKCTVCGATHLMCQYLMETYPQKLVVFTEFLPAFRYQENGKMNINWNCVSPNQQNPDGYTAEQYNDAIKKIVAQYGFVFFSMKESLGMSPYDATKWWVGDTTEGVMVHPNEAGHLLGSQLLASKLLSLRFINN